MSRKGAPVRFASDFSQLCQNCAGYSTKGFYKTTTAKNGERNLNPIGFSSVKKKHTAAIQIQTSDKAHTGIRGVKHLL